MKEIIQKLKIKSFIKKKGIEKMKEKIKTIIWIVIAIAIIVLIGIIGYGYFKKATMKVKNPILTMEVEGFGTVKMELYPSPSLVPACIIKSFTTLWNLVPL